MSADVIVSPVDGEMLVKKGKKMNPIYCYILNDITGELTRLKICEYRVKENVYTSRKIYTFANCISRNGKNYQVTSDKFDRFANNKVFSFNDNYRDIYNIIRNTLTTRGDKAHRDYRRCEYLLGLLKGEK